MDNDRELLELAARAYWGAEIDDVCSIRWLDADQAIGYTHGDNQDHNGQDVEYLWNPLTDDGDRYRLIGKLKLSVDFSECTVWRRLPGGYLIQEYWSGDYGDEPHAVLIAAASIGKAMPAPGAVEGGKL